MEKHDMKHEGHHEHEHSEAPEDKEITSWLKKLILSWLFTLPIAAIMLADRLFSVQLIPEEYMLPAFLILAFPVIFIFGFSTLSSGLRGIFSLYFNMDS